MHELGITQGIVETVVEAAKGRKVVRVVIEIGKLSGVMADAVAFCFDVVVKETPLEGAKLEILEPTGVARCRACEREFPVADLYAPCACGGHDIVIVRGEELSIKSMELEDAA